MNKLENLQTSWECLELKNLMEIVNRTLELPIVPGNNYGFTVCLSRETLLSFQLLIAERIDYLEIELQEEDR